MFTPCPKSTISYKKKIVDFEHAINIFTIVFYSNIFIFINLITASYDNILNQLKLLWQLTIIKIYILHSTILQSKNSVTPDSTIFWLNQIIASSDAI